MERYKFVENTWVKFQIDNVIYVGITKIVKNQKVIKTINSLGETTDILWKSIDKSFDLTKLSFVKTQDKNNTKEDIPIILRIGEA